MTDHPAPSAPPTLAVTIGQRGLWFLDHLAPGGTAYHLAAAFRVVGPVTPAEIRAAFARLLLRHEALATVFPAADGEPRARTGAATELAFREHDATGWGEAGLAAAIEDAAYRPFDLERGPLFRVDLFTGRGEPRLVVSLHHMVGDFSSLSLLLVELAAGLSEEPGPVEPAPPFTPFAAWQNERLAGEWGERLWAYWRGELEGLPDVLDLPADRQPSPAPDRPAGVAEPPAAARWVELPPATGEALDALARASGTTPFVVLLAAWQALLGRYTDAQDLAVGVPMAGRPSRWPGVWETVGYFVNPVVLRGDLTGDPAFAELLARGRRRAFGALRHQEMPLPLLIERLRRERGQEVPTPFRAMLVVHREVPGWEDLPSVALGEAGGRLAVGRTEWETLPLPPRGAQLDLMLHAGHRRGRWGLALHYNTDLFDLTTAERLLAHLGVLLGAAVRFPERRLSEIRLLTGAERHQLAFEWNDTERGGGFAAVPAVFAAQAAATPERPALAFGGERLTYAELLERVERLADHLQALGVGPETPVGIFLRRGPELLIGLLAVLRAGGCYIPLDVYYPEERLAFMLEDAGVPFVLTQASLVGKLAHLSARLPAPPVAVLLDPAAEAERAAGGAGERRAPVSILPRQAAYIIYTSGSTGRPKGVLVTHGSLANMLGAVREHPTFTDTDRLIAVTPISFDISVCEMFLPLTLGAQVTILNRDTATDGAKLGRALFDTGTTLLQVTPATWRMLLADGFAGNPATLRTRVGGEAMSPGLARELLPRCREVWNMYGPTEATVWSTAERVTAGADGLVANPVPIGLPIGGTVAHVLDRAFRPVPVGVAGELTVGGASLARGYLGRPELTALRFVPDPFAGYAGPPGGRLYRTGDLARRNASGSIEFLGRLDHQVKVRGFRIELGEIEAVLARHPAVREEVVVARDDGQGEHVLVAYVVPIAEEPEPAELRRFLAETLPDYMVPGAFVFLPAFPLSPSGKVDRKALPVPQIAAGVRDGAGEPRGALEELVAAVFADLLGTLRLGRDDGFFDLGGHSLLAARALARLRDATGVELPLSTLFEEPTVAGLARRLEASRRGPSAPPPSIPRVPRTAGAVFPLSFAQERLWFLERLRPTAAYNMPLALDLAGPLDLPALAGAFAAVVGRHEALFTAFEVGEEGTVQRLLPAGQAAALPQVDLSGLPTAVARAVAAALSRAFAARPFDLATEPPSRALLLQRREGDHRLVWSIHHAAGDAWSLGILLAELGGFYAAALDPGAGLPLPPAPRLQIADFALFERAAGGGEGSLAHWRQRLAGLEPLELPADRPRPSRRSLRGATRVERLAGLAPAVAAAGRQLGATPFMVLLAAFGAVVARAAGRTDFAVGTAAARRGTSELEGTVGPFLNTLVLRLDLGGEPSFAELVARARRTALEAYLHQELPFERLVEALGLARDAARPPLVSAMLVLQTAPLAPPALPGLAVEVSGIDTGAAQLDLSLSLLERGEDLEASLQYASDLFDPPTVQRFLSQLAILLGAALAEPGRTVAELPWLTAAQRHQLAVEWPAAGPVPAASTDASLDGPTGLDTFAVRALATPEALAVTDGETAWTYAELAARAEALAHRLLALGVAPGDVVAVIGRRTPVWLAGLLSLWQAGAVYLPLDPALPDARLAFLLADSQATLALCGEAEAARLARLVPALPLAPLEVSVGGGGPLPARARAADLAYLIYTSGTTGRPKGVAVEHRQLSLLLAAARETFGDASFARFAALATFSFDISVFELLMPLTAGGTVVLVPLAPTLDVAALAGRMGEFTGFHAVPAVMRQLVHALTEAGGHAFFPGLRAVLTGGDAVPVALLAELGRFFPAAAVRGLYGPTETTILVTAGVSRDLGGPAGIGTPLGRPLPGAEVRVVDDRGAPAPIGVAGELWIGGCTVARGYLHQPDLDAEKFVLRAMPATLAAPAGGAARFYRSGDLARFLPDGRLEFLGRIDRQVKVRGFRIEPGEIEAALARLPGVREAAVLAVGEGDGRRLVAYWAGGAAAPDPEAMRAALAGSLPDYMVPSAFVVLPELPLSPTGKVDRKALEQLAPEVERRRPYEPPADPVEETLAALWTDLLGAAGGRIGALDDFFASGGHSLLATRLASRIRTVFDVDLPLAILFERTTVRGQAAAIEDAWRRGARGALPPITPAPPALRGEDAPLSFAQSRLWFLDRLDPGRAVYNLPIAVDLRGPLDADALALALAALVQRQGALATVFPAVADDRGERPVQRVLAGDTARPFLLPRVDLARLGQRARAEGVRIAGDLARRPFDLARGPLFRPVQLAVAADEAVLSAALHHIVGDGWSMSVLARELEVLYGALAGRVPADPAARPAAARAALERLPPLAVQYVDYARWQAGALGASLLYDLAFWRRELAGLPPRLELPTDHPRPAVQGLVGARRPVALAASLTTALGELAADRGATLYMTLLAGLAAVLGRYSRQSDFAIGSPVAGRNRQELEGLIGFFVNTLVLRADLSGAPSFADLLARAKRTVVAAQMHQDLPFERLVEELAPERSLAWSPLFQVMLAFQGAAPEIHLPGLDARPLPVATGTAKFDWVLDLAEHEGGLTGSIEYDRALFDPPTLDRLAGHLATLLEAAARNPEAPAAELPLLTAAEAGQLAAWDEAPDFTPATEPLHRAFERQAERTPHRIAVSRQGIDWTYQELNRRANRLARHLQSLGIGPETTVGIHLPRELELVAALLGVLKAGGAYVPLDPKYPAERLAFTLEDAKVEALVTSGEAMGEGGPVAGGFLDSSSEAVAVVSLEALWLGLGSEDDLNPPPVDPAHLAYLIYTSGSTGRPKGVAIEHRNAVALVRWALATYTSDELAHVLASTSIGFDLSIFEIFATLAAGGRVVVAADALELPELREAAGLTLLNTVPSAIAELARAGAIPPSVATLNLAGEPLRGSLVREAFAASQAKRVLNLYGPTEDTTYSTFAVLEREPFLAAGAEPTIGRLVAGGRAVVHDRAMGPLPVGVPGELYLGGAGVTRGYIGRPDLTAERYVPDPQGPPGGRLYKTGDLVRRLADGTLDYFGRLDAQVKIRGFRVEPGEVEAILLEHPAVETGAVGVREDAAGGKALVAWVVARPGADFSLDGLRAFLAARLPAAMVPASVALLPELPLLPNGKIDRRALATREILETPGLPDAGAPAEPPRGLLEETLAAVWEEVLGRTGIGRGESFFDLGGHSLLATQVVARVRATLGVELPLRALFEAPTLGALALRVESQQGVPTLPPVAPSPLRPAPLSFAQARLWFLDQIEPGSSVYNLPLALELRGPLDRAGLAGALAALARRHEALRTSFRLLGAEPAQIVAGADAAGDPLLPVVDLAALPPERARREAEAAAAAEARRPFDLERGPLLRAALFARGLDDHLLVATLHHTVGDGWSMGIFARELLAFYQAGRAGRPAALAPLPVQYSDYALWQRRVLSGELLAAEVDFWRRELSGLPPALELPLDHPRPPLKTYRGDSLPAALPAALADGLRRLARERGATLFMALLAAFEVLLYRHSHQEDFAVGTPVAGRRDAALEGLIGFFVNTLVLRADLAGNPSFGELVARARGRALGAQAHQDLPFEKLVEELNPERILAQSPLFQVMLVLQNLPRPALSLPGLEAAPVVLPSTAAKFDLLLAYEESEGGLAGALEWNPDLLDRSTALRLLDRFAVLIVGALADPGRPLADLPLLPAAEEAQLLGEWSGAGREFPRARAIHDLVEEQAAARPDAIASSYEGEELSYGALNAAANRLAHRLRQLGCGLEAPAAVFLPRSPGLPVALLAALKAGGPYVPIDAEAPVDRLGYVLADSGARALVTLRALADRLGELPPGLEVVWIDARGREEGEVADRPAALDENPAAGAGGTSAAYVIYTSGSTGRPKGVAVTHAEVLRLLEATDPWFGFGPHDTWALFFSYAFDFSVWEIWGALMRGGRLVVLPFLTSRAPDLLLATLAREEVTVLNQTSSAFRQMIPLALEPEAPAHALRVVIFGGEALDVPALGPWFERFGDEQPQMINMYGITETTVHTTYRRITRADVAVAEASGKSPIGGALPDLTLHLLGPRGEAVPLGVPGEIAVGGDGLARGYLNRPELTATRFVPDPYAHRHGRSGMRLYRSGDLARYLPNGDMEYLGRIDFQVKIRGFRVELGEIEAVLANHPEVQECAVLAREDRPGDRRLVGYAVPVDLAEPPTPEALRAALKERLPDYMVPAAIVVLPAFPLTVNGKLDRRALPRPDWSGGARKAPPRNPAEAAIAEVWKEILGVPDVGVEDNFFDLGGHSLLLVQVHRRLKESFPQLAVVDLFRFPTIAALAGFLSENKVEQISLAESQARGQDRGDRARRQREMRRQVGLGRKGG